MARLSLYEGEEKDRSDQARTRRNRAFWIAPAAALAMTLLVPASCIITSTPDFEPPEQTPPFLVSENASPDLRRIVLIQPDQDEVPFSAFVRSEDDGQQVKVRLLIDYGLKSGESPFPKALNGKPVDASTMSDRSRVASAKWTRGGDELTPGCHSFTLMVSHAFDDFTDCPVDLSDSDSLTWNAYVCATGMPECPPPLALSDCLLEDEPSSSCPQFSSDETTSTGTVSTGGVQ